MFDAVNENLPEIIESFGSDTRKIFANGQIEYLLTECVRQRKKNGKYVSEHLDEHPEFDIK